MPQHDWPYTDEELRRYFNEPLTRRTGGPKNGNGNGHRTPPDARYGAFRGFFRRHIRNAQLADAVFALSILAGAVLFCILTAFAYVAVQDDEALPSLQQLEKPALQLATVAYTADGKELARYARQNRSTVTYEEISPHVINALIATEDHRFYNHWGIDLFRLHIAVIKTLLGDTQGGSTITMQLARNLYNKEIGKAQTPGRKLKEMVTAVRLERRYTKREIIEMYLNTVEFGYNAFGIETGARTFFNKSASELDLLESATLVGMQKAITYYNPVRNPENARIRRNVVLQQMIKRGLYTEAEYRQVAGEPVVTDFNSSEITEGPAPYFAEHVRNWLNTWGGQSGYDVYADGLVVFTTLDSRLQELAQAAVDGQMQGLQAVVDYEWSRRPTSYAPFAMSTEDYLAQTDYEPFAYFWSSRRDTVESFIRESRAFQNLTENGLSRTEALDSLRANEAFMAELKEDKTRLEAGLVSIDPRNGHVKTWVGGRDLKTDWYDKVANSRRQPGSTFKPFVYIAAIDNGFSPQYTLPDCTFTHIDELGREWTPRNSEGVTTGRMLTLRDGLKDSKNTITGRLMLQILPPNVAFYARRMGIESPLNEVMSLALGTSNVTLLELTSAYSTLANGGLHYSPTVVTRIEDRSGNVLYEAEPTPEEALSEETAYTVIDMMRDVVDNGTAVRVRGQFGLYGFDFAGKTGTTQNSADGWFMLMHPELVTGAWVGFNDPRVTFRTNWWGQGAHNALFLVGDYTKRVTDEQLISKDETFPLPLDYISPDEAGEGPESDQKNGRVSW